MQDTENVCVLGYFDGVHKGHAALIRAAKEYAVEVGAPLAAFTFSYLPTKEGGRLMTREDRDAALVSLGVDVIYTADFEEIRDMSAEKFVKDVLIDKLHTRVAFSGVDFRFGKGGASRKDELCRLLRGYGKDAVTVDEVRLFGEKISTSQIKADIADGKIKEANEKLSSPYFISSRVEKGRGVGKTLGFPTLNCAVPDGVVLPKNGVYETAVVCEGRSYSALTNVGVCPTFDPRKIHAESFLTDAVGDFYGKDVRIYFLDRIRGEMKFESAQALSERIKEDVKTVKERKNVRKMD